MTMTGGVYDGLPMEQARLATNAEFTRARTDGRTGMTPTIPSVRDAATDIWREASKASNILSEYQLAGMRTALRSAQLEERQHVLGGLDYSIRAADNAIKSVVDTMGPKTLDNLRNRLDRVNTEADEIKGKVQDFVELSNTKGVSTIGAMKKYDGAMTRATSVAFRADQIVYKVEEFKKNRKK